VSLKIELKIVDPRLPGWGFPRYGSSLAAGLDLFACLAEPALLRPQAPPALISTGLAFHIADPDWCALVLPRSGLGHRTGLVLGNAVGLIDADYEGTIFVSAWNRNPVHSASANPSRNNPTSADLVGDEPAGILIQPGDRIAQLVFTRVTRPEFTVVEAFSTHGDRRQDGFGSTGVASACPNRAVRRNS
jgi:dUTP pyrophosphatase